MSFVLEDNRKNRERTCSCIAVVCVCEQRAKFTTRKGNVAVCMVSISSAGRLIRYHIENKNERNNWLVVNG